MEYVTFGSGTQPVIIIPGLGDALKTVKDMAGVFSIMYRTYAKYFKVYIFSRKNVIPKEYSVAEMAARYPNLVNKLVLANTAAYANDVIKTVVESWLDMAEKNDFRSIFIDTAEKTYSEKRLKMYRRCYGILSRVSKPKSLERFIIQGNACMTHDARVVLKKIQIPTLVIGHLRKQKILTSWL